MKQRIFPFPISGWRWAIASVLTLSLAACGGNGQDTDTSVPTATASTLIAALSGDQETTPTQTGASGTGTLTLSKPSLTLTGGIVFEDMTATMAHIHIGDLGTNGAVIVNLVQSSAGNGTWSVPTNTVLTAAQATAFSSGGLYFNVHSNANPAGEIRGQIGREVFAAQLSSSQEVPPNPSTASGVGWVSLDPSTKQFSARMVLTGMTATAAHIHTGTAGVNGPILFHMSQTEPNSGIWTSAVDAVMSDEQIKAVKDGLFYFNAHSTAYPGGEIRGQVARNVGHSNLSGAQEVPPNASSASGIGSLVIDPASRAVIGGISLTGMTATTAHIHTGPVDANGPVAIGLTAAGDGRWNVPENTTMTAAQLKAFKEGNLYFNAHSAAFPGGEIRGQIR